jgi:hypothetical protein
MGKATLEGKNVCSFESQKNIFLRKEADCYTLETYVPEQDNKNPILKVIASQ